LFAVLFVLSACDAVSYTPNQAAPAAVANTPVFQPTAIAQAPTVSAPVPAATETSPVPSSTPLPTVVPTQPIPPTVAPTVPPVVVNVSLVDPTVTPEFTEVRPEGFPTVKLNPVKESVLQASWFADRIDDMTTSEHWGHVLRSSLNEVKQYQPWCSWDIAFDLKASQTLKQGDARFPNCFRFTYTNNTSEDQVVQFIVRRAFTDWNIQKEYEIKADPYDNTEKGKPQGLFIGSVDGVTVWAQDAEDAQPTEYYVKGQFVSVGGQPTTVLKKAVLYHSDELSAAPAEGSATGKSTGTIFLMDFPKDLLGDIVLTIVVPPAASFDFWKGAKILAPR
jgi:hypothetical protein